jgi:superfamily II DNA helicase RecQ
MSPEYLISGDGMELAKTLNKDKKLGYFAVDESHCISVWGHDFRKNYLKLYKFRKKFPHIPILAVTATATPIVIDEIGKYLKMVDRLKITANFDRPNLYLKCVDVKYENYRKKGFKFCINGGLHIFNSRDVCTKCKINPHKYTYTKDELDELQKNTKKKYVTPFTRMELMKKYLNKYEGSKIIIYVNSRKDCTKLAEEINEINKKTAIAYHAGMSKKLREMLQLEFSSGKKNIIVSTIAFGMGIDQIVRCVLIFGASSSIEEYYQQIGRAGRDHLPAETILFYEKQKLVVSMQLAKKNLNENPDLLKIKKQNLSKMMEFCEFPGCRRRFILEYFQEEHKPKFFCCNNCDNCTEKKLTDYTEKIWNILYNKKKIKNEFNSKEIDLLRKNKLITGEKIFYHHPNLTRVWKRLVEYKKYNLENIPDKLRIRM